MLWICLAAVRQVRSSWVPLSQQEQGMAVLGGSGKAVVLCRAGTATLPGPAAACALATACTFSVLHSHVPSQQEWQPLE